MPKSDGAERPLLEGVTAATEQKHPNGDVVRTVPEPFVMLADYVGFPCVCEEDSTNKDSRLC